MGLKNLCDLVTPGGRLYLSVPIGSQRIEFNAHRVFAARTLPSLVPKRFSLMRFAYVDDSGELHENVDLEDAAAIDSYGCSFGCGIYEFERSGEN